ncbi:MAG: 4Fe-4S binding protein [Eubacterium sp.]|nr:4Fe-4S binding protein [Eubacterium sp.]
MKNKSVEKNMLFGNKDECCGCSVCASICPSEAIIMTEDEEGFLYPQIDKSKCINCNRCVSVCPLKKVD